MWWCVSQTVQVREMLKKQDAQWQIALRTCREILRLSLEFPDVIGYDRVLLLALLDKILTLVTQKSWQVLDNSWKVFLNEF